MVRRSAFFALIMPGIMKFVLGIRDESIGEIKTRLSPICSVQRWTFRLHIAQKWQVISCGLRH